MPALYDGSLGLRIRRGSYIRRTGVEERTATRDLQLLVDAGLFLAHGERRGRTYSASDRLQQVRMAARQERDPIADPYDGIGNVLSTGPGQQSLDLDVGR